MLSKSQIKLITGLQQKKYRKQHNLFFAEGIKTVEELLNSNFELEHLYTTTNVFPYTERSKTTIISQSELEKISALSTPNTCLAVFKIPNHESISGEGLIVALEDVRDPGNLGTIIRLCDWFGITQIVCSEACADVYNPKVVMATMGSLARVNVAYTNLEKFLSEAGLPVFGTFMDGDNIYKETLPQSGIIVMGNEANGISAIIEKKCTRRIAIPRFGSLQETESLNVATASAIILSEFRRNASEK